MITLSHISKWISNASARTFILKDINLTVEEGEFISIMGPSGSGKSTLLNVIGMLDEPDEGEYLFNGENVLKLKEKARSTLYKKHIGFVFQAYHLIDELTVSDAETWAHLAVVGDEIYIRELNGLSAFRWKSAE